MNEQGIILFDGVCNLCNSSVQFVIRHDPAAKFLFAPQQGSTGAELLKKYDFQENNVNSFVLIQNGKAYTKSTAALKVAWQLKGAIRLMYLFMIIPAFIRNAVYTLIANNRYKWFGRRESCMLPTPELQKRFLN